MMGIGFSPAAHPAGLKLAAKHSRFVDEPNIKKPDDAEYTYFLMYPVNKFGSVTCCLLICQIFNLPDITIVA